MPWLAVVVAAVAAAFGLVIARVARWAGSRGWIYHQKTNPRPHGMGTLGLLEQIYQPSMEHVIEERSSQRARRDQEGSGDDPDPGADRAG